MDDLRFVRDAPSARRLLSLRRMRASHRRTAVTTSTEAEVDYPSAAYVESVRDLARMILRDKTANWKRVAAVLCDCADLIETLARASTASPEAGLADEDIQRALGTFNGGVVKVADASNPRGYTSRYLPKKAMRAAIAAALRALTQETE
jgi:hypothetical protein